MFGYNCPAFAERVALVEKDRQISYEELSRMGGEIASQVGERTLVFLMAGNTAASIAGYVGFLNHRIVPLMLDANIHPELLAHLMETYRPAYVWAPKEKEATLREIACQAGFNAGFELEGYRLFQTGYGNAFALHENLCVLISTSGSTGSPKLVRQTYRNIEANTASIIEYLGIDENERAITSLPMNYVYGLSVIHTHLQAGASLVLTDATCYSKGFWEAFRAGGATSFAGVPFMYEMLDKLNKFKKDIEGLRTMTQAGGKLNADLQEKLTRYALSYGKKFIVMYGASEATARMAYLPMESALQKKGSIGIPIPGGRFELIDGDGRVMEAPGETGELVYYGDNVTYGYATCGEDLIREDDNRGRLATGDMARRDEDGYYYIVGRMKRFIKMFGNRINLDDVDTVLKKKLNTLDVVSSGKDDFLDIFVTDGALAETVYDFVFETFGINRKKMKVHVIGEIPHNASGKILYSQLEALKDDGE